jgi:hypothetical protein
MEAVIDRTANCAAVDGVRHRTSAAAPCDRWRVPSIVESASAASWSREPRSMTPSIDRREKTVSVGDFVVDVDGAVTDVDGGRHQTTRPSSSNHTSAPLRSMGLPSIEPPAAPRSMARVIKRGRQCREIDEGLHRS